MSDAAAAEARAGLAMGAAAYVLWGVLPLFWPLLRPAAALEILAHRIVWSLVFLALLLARSRRLVGLRAIGARRLGLLAIAALLVAVNWGVYIWAVNQHRVVETALGYFINPLVTVLLGVLVLRERLRRAQWAAIALATVAVAMLAYDYGQVPRVALVLAGSFSLYGLIKKKAGVGAVESLAVETAVLVGPALAFLVGLHARRGATFAQVSFSHDVLLALSGVVTAIPLLCFAGAANRVPLTTIGLLQYIAPTLQFLCGVFVFHEPMRPSRWAGFVLVWVALATFAFDALAQRRAHASRRAKVA